MIRNDIVWVISLSAVQNLRDKNCGQDRTKPRLAEYAIEVQITYSAKQTFRIFYLAPFCLVEESHGQKVMLSICPVWNKVL